MENARTSVLGKHRMVQVWSAAMTDDYTLELMRTLRAEVARLLQRIDDTIAMLDHHTATASSDQPNQESQCQ